MIQNSDPLFLQSVLDQKSGHKKSSYHYLVVSPIVLESRSCFIMFPPCI